MVPKYERVINNQYIILEDGLISSPEFGEGRLIPAMVIRPKKGESRLQDIVQIHEEISSGDVIVNWARATRKIFQRDIIFLCIQFVQPIEYILQIEFKIKKHYSLIDAMIQSRGLHLGTGKIGEKVSIKVPAGEMILVEIPNTGFDSQWDKLLHKTLYKEFKKQGISKKHLKKAVEEHVNHMREILSIRREIK